MALFTPGNFSTNSHMVRELLSLRRGIDIKAVLSSVKCTVVVFTPGPIVISIQSTAASSTTARKTVVDS